MLKSCRSREYAFTWYFPGHVVTEDFKDQFVNAGVEIINGDRDDTGNLAAFSREIKNILKREKFDIVHINTGSVKHTYAALRIVSRFPVKKVIAHSHNTNDRNDLLRKIVRPVLRRYIRKHSDLCAGCSKAAAVNMFGTDILQDERCLIIKNTIDTKKFMFDPEKRSEIRKSLSISRDTFLLGSVGSIDERKNQRFIIDLLNRIPSDCDVAYVIIGKGEQEDRLKEYAKSSPHKVIFTGVSSVVEQWLFAMDLFVMPSRHEGFLIAALEAEATGLPCVLSTGVPEEVDITKRAEFIPLSNQDKWLETIMSHIAKGNAGSWDMQERLADNVKVRKAGYDHEMLPEMVKLLYGE